MEFFDEIYKKLTGAASYTAKEGEKLTGLAKVKFNLVREKTALDEAYKEMGMLYYSQMKNSELDEKKISLAYDKIEKSIVEIERLNNLYSELSNTVICPACNEKLEKGVAFCAKCGAKLEEKQEDAE